MENGVGSREQGRHGDGSPGDGTKELSKGALRSVRVRGELEEAVGEGAAEGVGEAAGLGDEIEGDAQDVEELTRLNCLVGVDRPASLGEQGVSAGEVQSTVVLR